jgi:hypothetical protein
MDDDLLEIPANDNIEKRKFSRIYQRIPFPSLLITLAAIILGWIVTFWPRIWLAPPIEQIYATRCIYWAISLLWLPILIIIWRKKGINGGYKRRTLLFVALLVVWIVLQLLKPLWSPQYQFYHPEHCQVQEFEDGTVNYNCTFIFSWESDDCDFDCGFYDTWQLAIVFEGRKDWPFVWVIDVVEEPY